MEGVTATCTSSDGSVVKAQPPLHQSVLLPRRRHTGEELAQDEATALKEEDVLDPLAVWCGEVALLPKNAVDDVGLASNFASAGKLLSQPACAKAHEMWLSWSQEFKALSAVEGSRVMAADLRVQPNNQMLMTDTVWLSRKTWTRFSKLVAKGTTKLARWKLFLEETSAVRWGSNSAQKSDEKEQHNDDAPENQLDGGKSMDETALCNSKSKSSSSAEQAPPLGVKELLSYDGILCDHGKVNKPKAAFLVPRDMLDELLRCARQKEQAYKALYGNCRGVQRLRINNRDLRRVGSDEVCEICCPDWAHFANPNRQSRPSVGKTTETCKLLLNNGSPNGNSQTLEVPWEDGSTMTGSWLRKIVTAQAGSEIGDLYVCAGKGEQRLLRDDEVMDLLPAILRARVQRSETPAVTEVEGDAFTSSIFMGRR